MVLGREPRRPRRPPARAAGRRRAGARCSRWSRPASPRPRCGPPRASSGLRTWDKPAAACLASRVPYGTPVTWACWRRVERAETGAAARSGFVDLRVRHYGDLARLEVPLDELDRVLDLRAEVVDAVRAAGYRYVTLDLEGLRSGNLNQALG